MAQDPLHPTAHVVQFVFHVLGSCFTSQHTVAEIMTTPQSHVVATREPDGSWTATLFEQPETRFNSDSPWVATLHLMEEAALKECSIETVDRTEAAVR
jgi:hypothetical protein